MANTIKDEISDYLTQFRITNDDEMYIKQGEVVDEICNIIKDHLDSITDKQLT